MADLVAHGLEVTAPPGWEGRIFVRPDQDPSATSRERSSPADGPPAPPGEKSFPLVHLATIPIPPGVGDYGNGAVEDLGPHDAMIVVKEFDPAEASTALFAAEGMPRVLDPNAFDVNALLRTLPGQAGYQAFFRDGGRAFCLYVILGGSANRDELVPAVNSVLASVRVDPLVASTPAPTTVPAAPTVLAVVRDAADLTTLRALVATAGVEELLDGPGPLTLFAPDDAAFAAFPDTDALRTDAAGALDLLKYHIVREDIRVASTPAARTAPTAKGQDVTIAPEAGHLVVGGVATSQERPGSNGVVQVLGGVLTPPPA